MQICKLSILVAIVYSLCDHYWQSLTMISKLDINNMVILQIFVPYKSGEQYVVFCIDVDRKSLIYMNSSGRSTAALNGDKVVGERIMDWAFSNLRDAAGLELAQFKWTAATVPEQPDSSSGGVYSIWMMEHWDGRISQQQSAVWARESSIQVKRKRIVLDLLLHQENSRRSQVIDAAKICKPNI